MKITDERLKIWIDLGKWAVASVGLVIMTTIIDSGFKDREVGINEIKEYDKYVSIVTDNNKISERRLLAQYFAYVTPSEKLRCGWKKYLDVVEKEIAELEEKQEQIKKQLGDSTNLTPDKKELLKNQIDKIQDELTPTFQKSTSTKNYDAAIKWESIGFQRLIEQDLSEAIRAFKSSEDSYNSFHQVYEIGRYLQARQASGAEQNEAFWTEIYETILSDYSWKMPVSAKSSFQELTN